MVVHRPTEYEELLEEHGTRRNIEFFLEQRGQTVDLIDRRHSTQQDALVSISASVPVEWRQSRVVRSDLDRWLFEPDDVVVTVGPDGLVANVAKYLSEQLVIGVNPQDGPGPLAGVRPDQVAPRFSAIQRFGTEAIETVNRTMVEVRTDDGRTLRALNDVFIGDPGHQSARYDLIEAEGRESQSSSGIVVGTGTGSTGWCRSLWNDRRPAWRLPVVDGRELCWFVREAWPSERTGATLTSGVLDPGSSLVVTARSDGMVIFGDGMEQDRLELRWGQSVSVAPASVILRLAT